MSKGLGAALQKKGNLEDGASILLGSAISAPRPAPHSCDGKIASSNSGHLFFVFFFEKK
jgi:hypothetical protein